MLTILLVDDSPAEALLMSAALRKAAGASLHAVTSGAEAARYLQQAGVLPALIMLDVNLAPQSGFEVLEELRAAVPLADVPVVLFSHSELSGHAERARRMGAEFVLKPQGLAAYAAMMEQLLRSWLPTLKPETLPPDSLQADTLPPEPGRRQPERH